MNKYLSFIGVFILGVVVGWLNPIEGPLDWTYDEYSSQPAHKSPVKAAPAQKKEIEIPIFDEDEDSILYNINNLLIQAKTEEE